MKLNLISKLQLSALEMVPPEEVFPNLRLPPILHRLGIGRRHVIAIAVVVLIHCVFGLIFRWSLTPAVGPSKIGELRVIFLGTVKQIPLGIVTAVAPTLPLVQIPVVSTADRPTTAAAMPASLVLAPRPNPAEPNVPASAADIGPAAIEGMSMTLKVLVLPDGTIGDATVLKSSGRADVDAAALEYVRTHWHFLPAALNDVAIQYWTSQAVVLGR
jgi:TonB family protein